VRRVVGVLFRALIITLSLVGCSLVGRAHFGDIWLQAGHGLGMVGNHVAIALH
jgi:hypothetical protein